MADFLTFKMRATGIKPSDITELKLGDLDLIANCCVVGLRLEAGSDMFHRLHLDLEVIPDVELPVELSTNLIELEAPDRG